MCIIMPRQPLTNNKKNIAQTPIDMFKWITKTYSNNQNKSIKGKQ